MIFLSVNGIVLNDAIKTKSSINNVLNMIYSILPYATFHSLSKSNFYIQLH